MLANMLLASLAGRMRARILRSHGSRPASQLVVFASCQPDDQLASRMRAMRCAIRPGRDAPCAGADQARLAHSDGAAWVLSDGCAPCALPGTQPGCLAAHRLAALCSEAARRTRGGRSFGVGPVSRRLRTPRRSVRGKRRWPVWALCCEGRHWRHSQARARLQGVDRLLARRSRRSMRPPQGIEQRQGIDAAARRNRCCRHLRRRLRHSSCSECARAPKERPPPMPPVVSVSPGAC
jgi:hypothetical protein